MLSGKRILVTEDNDWIAAELVQMITDYRGVTLGPAQTNVRALSLIDKHPDGAILDGNLLDGPITPVARALCDKSIPLVVFTGAGLPSDLQRSHPDIPIILKRSPYGIVIRASRAPAIASRRGGSRTRPLSNGKRAPARAGGSHSPGDYEARAAQKTFAMSHLPHQSCFREIGSIEPSGSAPRSGRGGRRFKSCHSDQHLADSRLPTVTGYVTETQPERATHRTPPVYVRCARTRSDASIEGNASLISHAAAGWRTQGTGWTGRCDRTPPPGRCNRAASRQALPVSHPRYDERGEPPHALDLRRDAGGRVSSRRSPTRVRTVAAPPQGRPRPHSGPQGY
jgi:hypothetical protein